MNLNTKILIVRIIGVVIALAVIGFVIATFGDNEKRIDLGYIGMMACVLLAIYHESLRKRIEK